MTAVSTTSEWVRAVCRTARVSPHSNKTLLTIVRQHAVARHDNEALIGDDYNLTYGSLLQRSDRYIALANRLGIRKGDRVALILDNCPDYVAVWLGLTSIGVVVAFISTRLVGNSLKHCLDVSKATHVITSPSFLGRLQEAGNEAKVWVSEYSKDADTNIDAAPQVTPDSGDPSHVCLSDLALLIFTSGTTGLPKAAHVSHLRIVLWSEWFAGIADASSQDRLYDCLPMYHSVGGIVAVGAMLVSGGAVIIRRKFCAETFWQDIAKSRSTILQYIGELCRYINRASVPYDHANSLRLCIGNGLGADIWQEFVSRFNIPRIIEFYASTEGSFSLFNLEGRVGAIGRVPRFMEHRSPVALVRFDHAAQTPCRDADGFCEKCVDGETGEALGLVVAASESLGTRFEGYTTRAETETKLLRNVFRPGDTWYRTGDLMRRDAEGFFYFVDRIGDTFRWKGENVSTSEVMARLVRCTGVQGATVYGVDVPLTDGKAGMAALVTTPEFSWSVFCVQLHASLPVFAHPVFLRLVEALPATPTFKQTKQGLIGDGFNPAIVADPLYVKCGKSRSYERLDTDTYQAICRGMKRL